MLPLYQCHKKVRAAKIIGISATRLYLDDQSSVDATPDWFNKHQPVAGGYFVVYEDGYESFSPADAFEEGYTRIKEGATP